MLEPHLPDMVPTASTAPLGWNPADRPGSWTTQTVHYSRISTVRSHLDRRTPPLRHLDGLAPQGLMGVGVPEVNLLVLGAGDELLHGGMDVQTPQLIGVTLHTGWMCWK